MQDYRYQPEHKQRITILPMVDAVIREDMMNMEGNDNRNGFILRLIDRMMNEADIDLATTEQHEQDGYVAALHRIPVENRRIGIKGVDELAAALADRRLRIQREAYAAEQARSDQEDSAERYDITLRLTNDIYKRLQAKAANWTTMTEQSYKGGYQAEYKYYRRQKEYIERILWNYAEKPANERERIYCGHRIQQIEEVLCNPPSRRESLLITIRLDRSEEREEPVYRVAPYSLSMDAAGNYYYLVGISERVGDPSQGRSIASYRISRIRSITTDAHMEVADDQWERLRHRLRTVGVSYLLCPVNGDPDEDASGRIVVRLTVEGWRMYLSILRNRPRYINAVRPEPAADGTVTLEFDCSQRQIENYFYMFGAQAYIVQPAELRDRFKAWYETALLAYKES